MSIAVGVDSDACLIECPTVIDRAKKCQNSTILAKTPLKSKICHLVPPNYLFEAHRFEEQVKGFTVEETTDSSWTSLVRTVNAWIRVVPKELNLNAVIGAIFIADFFQAQQLLPIVNQGGDAAMNTKCITIQNGANGK